MICCGKVAVAAHLSVDFHTSPGFRPVYAVTAEFMRDIDHAAMAGIVRRWNLESTSPPCFHELQLLDLSSFSLHRGAFQGFLEGALSP